jgi:hypothetical protein
MFKNKEDLTAYTIGGLVAAGVILLILLAALIF